MKPENLKSKLLRYGFNFFPAFRASGAWLTHISSDMRTVRLKLPLKRKTRNYMGTLCGGNMYSAIDGIYVVMLIKSLGKEYIVWDKSAVIRYRKPSKETLYTEFELTDDEISVIRNSVNLDGKVDREYLIELKNPSGVVCAEITKTIHIRGKAV